MTNQKPRGMPVLVASSPLRAVDPRAKLVISMVSSLTVMMPFERLVIFMVFYSGFLIWSRLFKQTLHQIWRLKYVLVILFVLDTLFVDIHLATIVTLRIMLLAGVFTLFVCTTTADELRLALEKLRIPFRFAFSLSMAFQSVELLQREWYAIREAQMARGIWSYQKGNIRHILSQFKDLIALTVPAIVLTTRRAWAITEAACARGFDAPHRKPYHVISLKWRDWLLMCGVLALLVILTYFRF